MEPRLWQLKHRIKYVENLRSGRFKEERGNWIEPCGACAIGVAVLTMEKVELQGGNKLDLTLTPFSASVGKDSGCRFYWRERQMVSDYFNFSYLEIRDISEKFEGDFLSKSGLSHKGIATYIESKHITPYLYMIGGKHLEQYKQKVREEIAVTV